VAVRRDHVLRDGRLPRSLPQLPHAAADGGQAPVAVESGKAKRAQFRWACDHRLRAAFDTLADSSRRHNPWAADIYDRARARGASHPHAARILGRAWCQVIWRLWQDHDTYNPAKHTALQRLIAAAT
jgi:transposase